MKIFIDRSIRCDRRVKSEVHKCTLVLKTDKSEDAVFQASRPSLSSPQSGFKWGSGILRDTSDGGISPDHKAPRFESDE